MLNLGAIIFGFLFGVLIGSQIKTKSMDTQFTLASFVIIFIVGLVSAWQLGPFPFYTDMPSCPAGNHSGNPFRIFLCINWYFCR